MNQVTIERIKALNSKQKCEGVRCGDQAEWRIDVRFGKTIIRSAYAICCSKHRKEYEDTARRMRYDY